MCIRDRSHSDQVETSPRHPRHTRHRRYSNTRGLPGRGDLIGALFLGFTRRHKLCSNQCPPCWFSSGVKLMLKIAHLHEGDSLLLLDYFANYMNIQKKTIIVSGIHLRVSLSSQSMTKTWRVEKRKDIRKKSCSLRLTPQAYQPYKTSLYRHKLRNLSFGLDILF